MSVGVPSTAAYSNQRLPHFEGPQMQHVKRTAAVNQQLFVPHVDEFITKIQPAVTHTDPSLNINVKNLLLAVQM